jgi:hypothetical protein
MYMAATLSIINKTLNIFGYIPIISCISGRSRLIYGAIHVISAVAIAILSAAGVALNPALCSPILVAGLWHVFRGVVESVPYLGNIACIAYDLLV